MNSEAYGANLGMRCENCGHQASSSATFCLNCGTKVGRGPIETPQSQGGLPERPANPTPVPGSLSPPGRIEPAVKICNRCNADNDVNMKFCRQCGNSLSAPAPAKPKKEMGKTLLSSPPVIMTPDPKPVPSAVQYTPVIHAPTPVLSSSSFVEERTQSCPSCNGNTPTGFAFCQRCGQPLPIAESAPSQEQLIGPTISTTADGGLALDNSSLSTVQLPVWGRLVAMKRNGEEGQSHALSGDYIEIGSNVSSQLCFEDPYLAPLHARIEKVGAGLARIVTVDSLNGVYRRVRDTIELESGAYLLLGKELLRFDTLSNGEAKPTQLVQHGVSKFGSPMREAWGRLSLVLPNGGIRDVYYLYDDEVILGREEGDISFKEDEFLSRKHASFRKGVQGGVLADLGSANGTFIRILESANLSDGDILRIGDQMFRFIPS